MRFLFTMQPTFGHFHAMVPLARALQDHGHEVACATGKSFGPVVQSAGFRHFPCGLDFDGSTDILTSLPEWEAIRPKYAPLPIQQGYGFVLGLAPRMVGDLLAVMKDWQPAVIVRDPMEYAGYIAAELSGLPHASTMWAFYIDPRAWGADALHELRRRFGLPHDPGLSSFDRFLVLKFTPSSIGLPTAPTPPVTHQFCAPPFDTSLSAELPGWVHALPPRPTVYATLGTTFNQMPELFRAIIDALGTEDLNAIVTVGRSMDPEQFRPLPENVRVEQYIPHSLLMPHCDALVFHGGYNSLLSALWHGLPMVVTPLDGGDQMPNAMLCSALGLGILVPAIRPDPQRIRAAVRSVLEQPEYRARARQVQREIQALPDLSHAVKRLEILAEQTRKA